jgi:hypothetical protein
MFTCTNGGDGKMTKAKRNFFTDRNITAGEVALNLTAFAACVLLGAIAVYNISLYQKIFTQMLELPWVWLQWVFGVSGWGVIQLVEVMPILLRNELGFMALIALAAMTFPRVHVGSNSPVAQRLGDRLNLTPERWLFFSNLAATLTFGWDLFSVGRYLGALEFDGFIPRLNFGAIIATLVTVFIFQCAFILVLHAFNGRWLIGEGKNMAALPSSTPSPAQQPKPQQPSNPQQPKPQQPNSQQQSTSNPPQPKQP